MTLPIRRGSRRPAPRIRRASPRFAGRRIAAGVVALAAAAALYGAAVSPAFALRRLDVEGARYTTQQQVSGALGLAPSSHPNVFSLDTVRLRDALLSLPTVADAQLRITLPDRLVVTIDERRPILVWAADDLRWLVDVDGAVIGPADPADPSASGLPVFLDDRTQRTPLSAGATLDPLDLAVARRLGALTPALLHSSATALTVTITDADGFAISTVPRGWTAILGIYTPSLHSPQLIPSQVQCLRSLLAQVGEKKVSEAYLFPEGDQCGTYSTR